MITYLYLMVVQDWCKQCRNYFLLFVQTTILLKAHSSCLITVFTKPSKNKSRYHSVFQHNSVHQFTTLIHLDALISTCINLNLGWVF